MHPSRLPLALLLATSTLTLAACSGAYDGSEDDLDEAESAIKVCPGATTVEGIDVSAYQPNNNWANIKAAGIKFAFIKATEDTNYTNAQFTKDWAGAKANGILRGAYHFFRADADGVAQADHFVNVMGALGADDLPGVLDLETTDGQSASTIAQRALAFVKRVEEKTGKKPIIYSGYYFWNDSVAKLPEFKDYPLWIPNYGAQCPLVPEVTWSTFAFWQYSSTGSVSGVTGNVDRNIFNGSLTELKAFASGAGSDPLPSQVTGNDAITVVNWPADKHAEVFATTATGDLVHTWSEGETDTWVPIEPLDTGATCGFSAGFWPSPKNQAEVFSPKADGTTQNIAFDGTMWGSFQDFGGKGLTKLSTLTWPDGHLEVFARGEDGAVWHNTWQGAAGWSDWQSMGGTTVTGVSPIVWGDGHAELMMTDIDGEPWLNFSGDFAGGWFGWLKLEGHLSSRPIPVRWADGHIELFARGADGFLHHALFNGQKWGAFTPVETTTPIEGEPSVFMNPGDKGSLVAGPEVIARDASGAVVHLWWTGSSYTKFEPLLGQQTASDPFGWMRSDGHAEVFTIDEKGELMRLYRSDSGWMTWASLGGDNLNPCIPGFNPGAGAGGGGAGGGEGVGAGAGGGGAGAGPSIGTGDEASCSCRVGMATESDGEVPSGWIAAALAPLLLLRRRRALLRRAR